MPAPDGRNAWSCGDRCAQQLLYLVARVPGINQQAGEGMPQIVDAHIGKAESAPNLVPELIYIGERLVRRVAGEEPRTARHPGDGADDRYGLVEQ